jgi:hypothetical protein
VELVDDLPADELGTVELAGELRESGNLHPLIARLRDGDVGPERARGVLLVLAELDVDLLVQITLDALIDGYLTDPGIAHQPRRVFRPQQDGSDPA